MLLFGWYWMRQSLTQFRTLVILPSAGRLLSDVIIITLSLSVQKTKLFKLCASSYSCLMCYTTIKTETWTERELGTTSATACCPYHQNGHVTVKRGHQFQFKQYIRIKVIMKYFCIIKCESPHGMSNLISISPGSAVPHQTNRRRKMCSKGSRSCIGLPGS